MAGKSRVTAGDQQRNALLTLAHSRDRGEADRARAILLTLSGWTSPRIAEAFSVGKSSPSHSGHEIDDCDLCAASRSASDTTTPRSTGHPHRGLCRSPVGGGGAGSHLSRSD